MFAKYKKIGSSGLVVNDWLLSCFVFSATQGPPTGSKHFYCHFFITGCLSLVVKPCSKCICHVVTLVNKAFTVTANFKNMTRIHRTSSIRSLIYLKYYVLINNRI